MFHRLIAVLGGIAVVGVAASVGLGTSVLAPDQSGLLQNDAQASTLSYTTSPTPADLWGLQHAEYYTWGIQWTVPAGMNITDATLRISHINNWTLEADNDLYIHLLDKPKVGVTDKTDTKTGDQFAGQGALIVDYVDHSTAPEDLSYRMSDLGLLQVFQDYAADGVFGFGFDPDCHYDNNGISLTIEYGSPPTPLPVPEPVTLVGAVLGLGGLARYIRKR